MFSLKIRNLTKPYLFISQCKILHLVCQVNIVRYHIRKEAVKTVCLSLYYRNRKSLPQGWKHKYVHDLVIILGVGFTADHNNRIADSKLRALLLHRFEQLAITYQEQFAIGVLFVVLCEQLHQELMILGNCEPPDVSQNKSIFGNSKILTHLLPLFLTKRKAPQIYAIWNHPVIRLFRSLFSIQPFACFVGASKQIIRCMPNWKSQHILHDSRNATSV